MTEHTCYGAIFCGQPREEAKRECPACPDRQPMIGHYSARQQVVVLKLLTRERGQGWGVGMARAEYQSVVLRALADRYGVKEAAR